MLALYFEEEKPAIVCSEDQHWQPVPRRPVEEMRAGWRGEISEADVRVTAKERAPKHRVYTDSLIGVLAVLQRNVLPWGIVSAPSQQGLYSLLAEVLRGIPGMNLKGSCLILLFHNFEIASQSNFKPF